MSDHNVSYYWKFLSSLIIVVLIYATRTLWPFFARKEILFTLLYRENNRLFSFNLQPLRASNYRKHLQRNSFFVDFFSVWATVAEFAGEKQTSISSTIKVCHIDSSGGLDTYPLDFSSCLQPLSPSAFTKFTVSLVVCSENNTSRKNIEMYWEEGWKGWINGGEGDTGVEKEH